MIPQLNTGLRAELAAILIAIHSITTTDEITLMTESVTSLQLINNMLTRPQGLQHHKHRHLLSELTQSLWSRQAPITAHKVRAHIGCSGNERADRLSKQAHTPPQQSHTLHHLSLAMVAALSQDICWRR